MPRLRRYRVFVVGAVFMLFLLWRGLHTDDWADSTRPAAIFDKYRPHEHDHAHGGHQQPAPHRGDGTQQHGHAGEKDKPQEGHKGAGSKPSTAAAKPTKYWDDDEGDTPQPTTRRLHELKTSLDYPGTYALPVPTPATTKAKQPPPYDTKTDEAAEVQKTPPPAIPDRPPSREGDVYAAPDEGAVNGQRPPGYGQRPAKTTTSSVIRWHKVPEHYPVPTESLIRLPTGRPRTDIPKVQFDFKKKGPEPASIKEKRTARLAEVRKEMKRAWDGYRTHAWMHDEIKPVSGGFRDPFCGWAATLVDALDTLWIMGLRKEFDEAVTAVGKIDFTTTPYRDEIPVFETTIRYLGGLLSAYDVATADPSASTSGSAGANYTILLTKATELAEILMGVFDTPNRMPVLYYNWTPKHASQPQRARHVSVAEVGSLLMEFTRLSQLTGEPKYYDAVARITNAFEELQKRGTSLNGIFPESLDASGCNRTAAQARAAASASAAAEKASKEAEAAALAATVDANPIPTTPPPMPSPKGGFDGADPEGYVPTWVEQPGNNKAKTKPKGATDAKSNVEPRARDQSVHGGPQVPRDDKDKESSPANRVVKRNGDASAKNEVWSENRPLSREASANAATAAKIPVVDHSHVQRGVSGSGSSDDDECDPQPALVPGGYGLETYSMGGSQDSTYEYFPKEFLLLGGLEKKYRVMHEKVVAAVKKYLLYRPMVPGDHDILFSAKVTTKGNPEKDAIYEYEVTHLTCFLGGMFALGGRIFSSSDDLAIASRLTDGCVWAYASMPSGIMPEGALVVPCPHADDCRWNETLWHRYLDPSWETRDAEVEKWMQNQKVLLAEERKKKAEEERKRKEEEARKKAEEDRKRIEEEARQQQEALQKAAAEEAVKSAEDAKAAAAKEDAANARANGTVPDVTGGMHVNLDLTAEKPEHQHHKRDSALELAARDEKGDELAARNDRRGEPAGATEAANTNSAAAPGTGAGATGGTVSQSPLTAEELASLPYVPPTHAQFVESRIKNERLPKGWVSLNWKKYILRYVVFLYTFLSFVDPQFLGAPSRPPGLIRSMDHGRAVPRRVESQAASRRAQ